MNPARDHRAQDRINAAQDRRVAAIIRRDPRRLRQGQADLARWIGAERGQVRRVFREWQAVLHRLTPREVATFLCSNTPMARRLRQSSPLAGILPAAERRKLLERHAKKRA